MNKIEHTRTVKRNGNLFPPVHSVLADLQPDKLHHQAHSLRQPGAIYNVSTNRLLEAFTGVLDQLDDFFRAPLTSGMRVEYRSERLLAAQRQLLESMVAHIEDSYLILKACRALAWSRWPRLRAMATQISFKCHTSTLPEVGGRSSTAVTSWTHP